MASLFLLACVERGTDALQGGVSPGSRYVKKTAGNRKVVIFVHGVLGDSTGTWINKKSKAFWPGLLSNDPAFADFDVYVYEYPTPFGEPQLSIVQVADRLRNHLATDGVTGYEELYFLSHSMGGLVSRQYLLGERMIAKKVALMYFLSTPTGGSEIARYAEAFGGGIQFQEMKPPTRDAFLDWQLEEWLRAGFSAISSYCGYETRPTEGIMVVPKMSAVVLCTMPLDPIDDDHLGVAKPYDSNADSYRAFKHAVIAERERKSSLRADAETLVARTTNIVALRDRVFDLGEKLKARGNAFGDLRDKVLRQPAPEDSNRLRQLKDEIERLREDCLAYERNAARLEVRPPRDVCNDWIRPAPPTGLRIVR